jgi:hypothetical protein
MYERKTQVRPFPTTNRLVTHRQAREQQAERIDERLFRSKTIANK